MHELDNCEIFGSGNTVAFKLNDLQNIRSKIKKRSEYQVNKNSVNVGYNKRGKVEKLQTLDN